MTIPTICYVTGTGRSGSTLLDMMLGGNSAAFSLGQFDVFIDWLERGDLCTCGQPLNLCPVWSEVLGKDLVKARELVPGMLHSRRHSDKLKGALSAIIQKRPVVETSPEVKKAWSLLERISEKTGARVLVDSTKGILRLIRLAGQNNDQIKVLHLIRDPRGTVAARSTRREVLTLKGEKQYTLVLSKWEATFNWFVTNFLVFILGMTRFKGRYMILCYEDLIKTPETSMKALSEFLEIQYERAMLPPLYSKDYHTIGGNHSRFGGYTELKLDERWKKRLKSHEKIAISTSVGWLYALLKFLSRAEVRKLLSLKSEK